MEYNNSYTPYSVYLIFKCNSPHIELHHYVSYTSKHLKQKTDHPLNRDLIPLSSAFVAPSLFSGGGGGGVCFCGVPYYAHRKHCVLQNSVYFLHCKVRHFEIKMPSCLRKWRTKWTWLLECCEGNQDECWNRLSQSCSHKIWGQAGRWTSLLFFYKRFKIKNSNFVFPFNRCFVVHNLESRTIFGTKSVYISLAAINHSFQCHIFGTYWHILYLDTCA